MMLNRHWALPLAFAGGIALGTALTLRRRQEQRRLQQRRHHHDLQSWEGEGGNLAPAAEHSPRAA